MAFKKTLGPSLAAWLTADLLPGLALVVAVGAWWGDLRRVLSAFLDPAGHFALLVLVLLGATAGGKVLGTLGWMIYDRLLCRTTALTVIDEIELRSGPREELYEAVVLRTARHHRCLAGLSLVLPVLGGQLLSENWPWVGSWGRFFGVVALVFVEVAVFAGAVSAHRHQAAAVAKLKNLVSRPDPGEGGKVVEMAGRRDTRSG